MKHGQGERQYIRIGGEAPGVRIVYEPTGLTVVCQDERSQFKNKTRAMAMLRAKLLDAEQERHNAEISQDRRSQVGAADRSEKIRTYNYPQDRITDHRIGLSVHSMDKFLAGDIEAMVTALIEAEKREFLEAQA